MLESLKGKVIHLLGGITGTEDSHNQYRGIQIGKYIAWQATLQHCGEISGKPADEWRKDVCEWIKKNRDFLVEEDDEL